MGRHAGDDKDDTVDARLPKPVDYVAADSADRHRRRPDGALELGQRYLLHVGAAADQQPIAERVDVLAEA